jgi:putative endonuclease
VWKVYILKCSDDTLYTGITNDLHRRIEAHNQGVGAKYTRCRLPVSLVYFEEQANRSAASKRELEIKSLSRAKKNQLIHNS